jgi:hypothetical protein
MMIKPPLCLDCQKPLKTRKSLRCQTCASRKNHLDKGYGFTPEEAATLKILYSKQSRYYELKKECTLLYKETVALRAELLKRHSHAAITRKYQYMRRHGLEAPLLVH